MVSCPSCSTPIPEGELTCPTCGADAPVPAGADPVPPSEQTTADLQGAPGLYARGDVVIGRYEILSETREGGMGRLYRALDTDMDTEVALKFLSDFDAGNQEHLQQLRREVDLSRRVSHDNVCRVHDLQHDRGHYFIVMQWVSGQDLRTVLKKRGDHFSISYLIQIAKEICAGLDASHRNDVIHRDLKPANIMIDEDGSARITDFGIASDHTDPRHEILGTPEYVAPEQRIEGRADARSDLFSLGCVLFEMFSGKPLRDGDLARRIKGNDKDAARAVKELPDVHAELASVDEHIREVIAACLAIDPDDRPASARDVADRLDPPTPVAPVAQVPPARRRNWGAALGYGVVVAGVITTAAILLPTKPPVAPPPTSGDEIVPADVRAEDRVRDFWKAVHDINQDPAHRMRAALLAEQLPQVVEAQSFAPDIVGTTLRSGSGPIEYNAVSADGTTGSRHSQQFRQTLPSHAFDVVCLSSDGTAAVGASGGIIQITDSRFGATQEFRRITGAGVVSSIAASAGARRVLTGCADGTVNIYERGAHIAAGSHGSPVDFVDIGDGGNVILVAGQDGEVRIWSIDVSDQLIDGRMIEGGASLSGARLSRDGRYCVTWSREAVRLWNAATGEPVLALAGERYRGARLVRMPPERMKGAAVLLVIEGGPGEGDDVVRVYELDLASDSQVVARTPLYHRGRVSSVNCDPLCRRVITGCEDGMVRVWEFPHIKGAQLSRGVRSASFSRAGDAFLMLARGGERLESWERAGEDKAWIHAVIELDGHVNQAVMAGRQGEYIALVTDIGELRILDRATHDIISESAPGRATWITATTSGHRLAAARQDGIAIIDMEVDPGAVMQEVTCSESSPYRVCMTPGCELLGVALLSGRVEVHDLRDPMRRPLEFPGVENVRLIDFGPPAPTSTGSFAACIEDCARESVVGTEAYERCVQACHQSLQDGGIWAFLAVDAGTRTVTTWNITDDLTVRQIGELRHDGGLNDAEFTASGWVMTTEHQVGVNLWEPRGELIARLDDWPAQIQAAAMDASQRHLLVVDADHGWRRSLPWAFDVPVDGVLEWAEERSGVDRERAEALRAR